MFKNNFDTKQRFGIRKSTKWKTAGSVLLGTYAILSLNTGLASADEVTQPVATDPAITAVQPAAETSPATAEGDALNAETTTPASEAAPTVAEPAAAVAASEPAAEVVGISPDAANTDIEAAPTAFDAEALAEPVALEGVIADEPEVETNVDLSFERIGARDTSIGETEAYSGETLDFYANLTVAGVSETYKDTELVLTLQKSDLIDSRFGQENLSGYEQSRPVKSSDAEGNTTYTIKLGDLISGQSISLPFKFAFKNNLDAGAQATLALEAYAVVDGKRTLISSSETTVMNRTIPMPRFELALTSSNMLNQFDESGVQMFNAGNVQDKEQDGAYETILSNNAQSTELRLLNADAYSEYARRLVGAGRGGNASFADGAYLKDPHSDEIVGMGSESSLYNMVSSALGHSRHAVAATVSHDAANLNGSLDGGVVTLELQDSDGDSLSNQVKYHRQFTAVPYTTKTDQGVLSMKGSSVLYHRAVNYVNANANKDFTLIPDTGRIDSQSVGNYRNELSASEEATAPSNGDEFNNVGYTSSGAYITWAYEQTSAFADLEEGAAGYALASTYDAFPDVDVTINDPSAIGRLLISGDVYQALAEQTLDFKSVLTVQNNNNLREATDTLLFKNTFGVLSDISVVANMKDGTVKTIELSSQTDDILRYDFDRLEGVENVTITGQADVTKLFETDDNGNHILKTVVVDSNNSYDSVYLGGKNKASLTQDELTKLDAIALKSTLYGSYLNTKGKDYAKTTSIGTAQYTLGKVEVTNTNRELYDIRAAAIGPKILRLDSSGVLGQDSSVIFYYAGDVHGEPGDYDGLLSLYYIPDGYDIVGAPDDLAKSDTYRKSGYVVYEDRLTDSKAQSRVFRVRPTMGLMSLDNEATTSRFYQVIIDPNRVNDFVSINTDPLEKSFTDDLLGDGWNPAEDKDEGVTSAIQTVILPKTIFIYNKNTYTDSQPEFTTQDMSAGTESHIVTTLGNSSDLIYKDLTVITTIPQLGDDKIVKSDQERGSEFTTTLTGPVTPPAGWTVEYTIAPLGQSQDATKITDWNTTVDDFSQVTAVRYKSQPGITLSKTTVEFPITVKVPDNAKPGQKYVSTSAVSNNGSELYLEGYRTISEIKRTYGSVIVKYVDTNGNQLTDTMVNQPENTLTGTEYAVTAPEAGQTIVGNDGKTYIFVEYDATSDAEAGEVGIGEKEVRYVFTAEEEVVRDVDRGSHVVRFVDENGTELEQPITTLSDEVVQTTTRLQDGTVISIEKTDKTFNARPVRKDSIEKDGFVYDFDRVNDVETGTLQPGMNYTTYVYVPVPIITAVEDLGSVVVKYTDESGREIKQSVQPVSDVVTMIHETTTTPDGSTTSDIPNDATYDVTNEKVDSIVFNDFTYEYVRTDGVEAGDLPTGETVVTHVYKAVPKVDVTADKGSVVVRYVDENGHDIASSVMPVFDVVTATHTTSTTPDGSETEYTLSGATYDVTSAKVGEITFENFDYTLVRTEGAEYGVLPTGETVVTHVYKVVPKVSVTEAKGSVVVEFKDTKGNVIRSEEIVAEDVLVSTTTTTTTPAGSTDETTESGNTYTTIPHKQESIEFNGFTYDYVRVDGSETGTVAEGETLVTYVYDVVPKVSTTEDKGSVVVRFTDENGNEIKPGVMPVSDIVTITHTTTTTPEGSTTMDTPSGATYDVTAEKVGRIEFEGSEYALLRTEGSESGVLPTGETTVTHIYHKVVTEIPNEAPTHSAPELTITRWITEEGEELAPVETGAQEPKEFDGYTFESTEVDGPITTHIYHEVVTEIPNEAPTHEVPEMTITRWIDEDGAELSPIEEGTQEPKEFDGRTFENTEVDGQITTHVYHKVVTEVPNEAPTHSVPELTITRYITEEGEELSPIDEGTQEPREFDGHTFESTTTDGPITTHIYHKVVTEIPNEAPTHSVPELTITRYITEDGEEISPVEEGTQEPKEFDDYTFESTDVDGPVTTHTYHKVVTEIPHEAPTHSVPELTITRWISEDGEELSSVEEGTQEPKEFDGYTFESTTTDGPITTHAYHKVVTEVPNEAPAHSVPELQVTRWVTEDGEELTTTEEGSQDPREFEGYTLERAEVDGGIITHVYHKVITAVPNEAPTHEVPELQVTRWVTEDGEELSPIEEGDQEPKEFDGYTFESTEVDGGITTHVYHKVVTEVPNEAPTHEVPELEIPSETPETPETLEVPETPATPATPEVPETPEAPAEQPQEAVKSAPVAKAETAPLPETGDESNLTLTAMGLMLLGFVGIRKRRKD